MLVFVWLCVLNSDAQSLGNGQDGSPNIFGIVNQYAMLVNDAPSCSPFIKVDNGNAFEAGDLIIVVQMNGAEIDPTNSASYGTVTGYGNSGVFEYCKVIAVEGNTLILQFPLLFDYSLSGNTQIVNVPQYDSPTVTGILTCPAWNGSTGGILAIDVSGTLTLNTDISVMGKGFRGREVQTGDHIMFLAYDYIAEYPDPTWYAGKGEGIASYGIEPFTAGRGTPANAGGGGNIHTTGGGGGANGGCGGDGGWGYPVDTTGNEKLVFGIGGHSIDYGIAQNRIYLGGGGGAGHAHFGNGTSGASGGGAVLITANQINGNNRFIYARGNNSASSGAYGDGAGGAGAGGSVLINCTNISSNLYMDVTGGSGGSTVLNGFGPGGGGGGGIVAFNEPIVPLNAFIIADAGLGGLAGGSYYGAQPGCIGDTIFNFLFQTNTLVSTVGADFDYTLVQQGIYQFNNQSINANSYVWNYGDGQTDTIENPSHEFEGTGIFNVSLTAYNDTMCPAIHSEIIITDIPNVFTPNGDGVNDYFSFSNEFEDYSIKINIYNRWGELVYKNESTQVSWDGRKGTELAAAGTYYYSLEIIESESLVGTYSGYISLFH